jgi:hypothetical protein
VKVCESGAREVSAAIVGQVRQQGNILRAVAVGKIVTAVSVERVLLLRCVDSRRERTHTKMKQRNGGGRASKVVCCKCDK